MKHDTNITIALVGYGKMGKAIHHRMRHLGYPEPIIVDPSLSDHPVGLESVRAADVCIEFTRPDAVVKNMLSLSEIGIPIVCGTTGWSQHSRQVSEIIVRNKGAMIHASNFSIGIQILNRLAVVASSMIASFDQYDIALHEIHHHAKIDAPSGTALLLAETMLRNCPRKTDILTSVPSRCILPSELCVTSARVGQVVGRHEITIDSEADSIRIVHEAKNRTGFVEGALMAAQWIRGKQGYFSFEEVFDDIIAS